MRRMLGGLLALTALIAACGGADPAPPATGGSGGATTGGVSAVGPGLSIAEALTTTAEAPLLVRGFLVAQGDSARLCESLAESAPPRCGGRSLTVVGVDLAAFDGLDESEDTRWSPAEIMLLGALEGETLTVNPTATG